MISWMLFLRIRLSLGFRVKRESALRKKSRWLPRMRHRYGTEIRRWLRPLGGTDTILCKFYVNFISALQRKYYHSPFYRLGTRGTEMPIALPKASQVSKWQSQHLKPGSTVLPLTTAPTPNKPSLPCLWCQLWCCSWWRHSLFSAILLQGNVCGALFCRAESGGKVSLGLEGGVTSRGLPGALVQWEMKTQPVQVTPR